MPTQKILQFAAALIVIAALISGFVYFRPSAPVAVDYPITSIQDGTFTGTMPSLTREIKISDTTPDPVKAVLRQKVAEDQATLKKVPYDGNVWMDLALNYHAGNDYDGAREVWEFIITVTPTNVTALGNLGRLHHFELKNFETAEMYFKKAIDANPDRPEAYFELFDLYRFSYKKDTTSAVDIMKEAAKRFPDDTGIPASLGNYYRERGNTARARTYFEQALTMARTQNDMSRVQALTQELSTLP